MYNFETKKEMDQLSLEVFGSRSKWKKMIEQGVPELLEEDTTRLTIVDGVENKETVKTPVMHEGYSGGQLRQHQLKRYTLEEVREKLLFLKAQRDEFLAAIKKQQEDQLASQKATKEAEETKKTVEMASGSSI